ncbi:MAG: flagellar hook-basal body complex protein, partial [Rhodospirillales bacterium]|nr:flagellar hook-basal body complex protein [Rhodospirillales bacterium]
MTLSAFTISTLGMRAQATGLNVIGTNVSNLQTGGYKRADAHFQTMVSETMFEQSDTGGVRPKILQRNSVQGTLLPTGSAMDLAIIGDGFYVTRATFDSSGELLYTRDGAFEKSVLNPITTTDPNTGDIINTKDAWLVDKNGNYVLGFAVNADGTFPTSGTPAPMRVDQNAFIDLGTASTSAELGLNLDSNADVVNYPHVTAVSNYDNAGLRPDGMEVLTIDFVDSNGDRQEARLNFTKTASNIWDMSATYEGSGTAQINTITVDGVVDIGDTYDVTVNGQTA